jgi:hypothetical protein
LPDELSDQDGVKW